MKLSAFLLVLLAFFYASTTASAQQGNSPVGCTRGAMDLCWPVRFGRCAHQNPEIAIPACTRQLVNPFDTSDSAALARIKRTDWAQRFTLRAIAYAKQGDLEQAVEDLDRAIRTDRSLYWVYALRASALYAAGSEQDALASLNDAIDLAPDNPFLFNARARLTSTALDENVRNSAHAIADAQRASELVPDEPGFVAALATVYAESGDFENAVATQRRAIDMLEPGDQDALAWYQDRLTLYEQGMPFERPLSYCSTDDDPPDPNTNTNSNFVSQYLVFCIGNGNS